MKEMYEMTTTSQDCEALHAALDLDPSDQDTRRVLADWYEDAGVMVMADGLRWVADCEAFPEYRPPPSIPWAWRRRGRYEGKHCDVDAPFFDAMPCGDITPSSPLRVYPSRREAESALCRALAEVRS